MTNSERDRIQEEARQMAVKYAYDDYETTGTLIPEGIYSIRSGAGPLVSIGGSRV
jgi:hypothetical protein